MSCFCSTVEANGCMNMALFMEIKKRMQTGLLILRGPESKSLPLDISMTPSSLEMKNSEETVTVNLPLGLRLVPSSLRGVQHVPGDGLHLRLQVQAYSSTKLVPTLKESLKVQKSCTFHCQNCGATIVKERSFLRVLPLPNVNWNSLVEEWCCHANPFANKVLRPGDNDCFVGDTYILVNSGGEPSVQDMTSDHTEIDSSVSKKASAQKSQEGSRVNCKRCKAMLGERVSADTVKYYITEIIIQPSCKELNMLPRSCYLESVTAQHFAEFSSSRSTFRFSIQGHDGKIYLLLWLLNSATLLLEALGRVGSGNSFTLFEDRTRPFPTNFELRNAIKVLYHPAIKNRNNELVSAWENDIGVHSLTFPAQTCLELLLLLSSSNKSLPASLRCMNSFQVAFLKM